MLAVCAILIMIGLDQLVKYWALEALKPVYTIPVIQDVFHLTYVENRGAAFSVLQGKTAFLAVLTIVILIVVAYALKKGYIHTALGKWSLYFVVGGAVGNLIDRIFRGFVVDMFDFRLINFPVFNVADIFVCAGGALLAFYILFQHDKAGKNDE